MKIQRRQQAAIAASVLVVVALGVIVYWSGASHGGTIHAHKDQATVADTADKVLSSDRISLNYQNGYAKRILPPTDNNIELYELTAPTVYDKRLSVELTRLPSANLSDDGSYNLRRVHPQQYQERLVTTQYGQAHIMVKTDGTEQTVFLPHSGMLLTLAFVSAGELDKLPAEVNAVLASFRWKQ